MTTYSLRCRNGSCRHRRVSRIHPDDYKLIPRCAMCGLRSGWRIEGRAYNKRNLCHCSSVVSDRGNYPHRKGVHPLCDFHPEGPANQARRAGICEEAVLVEFGGKPMKPEEPCPF